MKKIKYLLFFIAIIFFAKVLFAQDSKTIEILNEMEKADKEVNSLEVSYSQEILFLTTNEKQQITGNLKYKKPNLVYIVQKTPQEQKIYIDGKTITIYTPENMQAVVDNWKNVISGDFSPASIVSFGSNWKILGKENEIKYVYENLESFILDVSPKVKPQWDMKLTVSKETYRPQKAVFSTAGIKITIIMKDYKTNPDLSKIVFKFKAPENVDVINLN